MRDISYEIGVIAVVKNPDDYIDILKDMIDTLKKPQNIKKEAYYSFISD
jgi:hypothetical protein